MVNDGVGDAPEEEPGRAGKTPRAHHDQIDMLRVHETQDALRGMALKEFPTDLGHAFVLGGSNGLAEKAVQRLSLGLGWRLRGDRHPGRPHDGGLVDSGNRQAGGPTEAQIDGTV